MSISEYAAKKNIPKDKKILDTVKQLGGKNIKNKNVTFVFDEKGTGSILLHARSAELQAAALAAPYVAKYGDLIAGQKNHESTGLATLTFAAPVIINGDTVNVGVSVQFQSNGKPKAVNVELQSGGKFVFDAKKVPAGLDSRVKRYVQGTSLPTTGTNKGIPQTVPKVKLSDENSSDTSDKNPTKRESKKIEDGRTLAESLIEEYKKPITFDDVLTLRSIGRKSVNAFTSEDIQKAGKWAYKFYRELGTKSPFFRAWFGDWRQYDKSPARFFTNIGLLNITDTKSAVSYFKSKLKSGELFRGDVVNKDTNFKINIGTFVYNDTLTYANRALSRSKDVDLYRAEMSVINNIRDIVENAIYLETSVADGKKDNTGTYQSFYHYFYSLVQVDGKPYMVRLAVDEHNSSTTVRRAYNVENIEISPVAVSQVYKPAVTTSDNGENLSTVSISDLFDIVKQFDKDFTPAPEVNPLLLNENRTPRRSLSFRSMRYIIEKISFVRWTKEILWMEQATGIEPALSAWEAEVLPLNYACVYLLIIAQQV